MRTIMAVLQKFCVATCRCPVALVLKSLLLPGYGSSCLSSPRLSYKYCRRSSSLYAHPPTQRDRAFPGPSHFLTRSRGCRCPQFARRKTIGAPQMITRMLQPPFPSRDLFPEFLKAEPSRQSRHGTLSPFFFLRQTRRHADIRYSAGCPDKLQTVTCSTRCPQMTCMNVYIYFYMNMSPRV